MKDTKETSFHEDFSRDGEVKGSSNRSFGFVFAVFFLVIGAWPLLRGGDVRIWALITSGAFLFSALLVPNILSPLNWVWTKFGLLLHKIVSPFVLGLMFFLSITPIALIMKLLGKDILRLKKEPATKSYWIDRNPPGPPPETMINQF